MTELDLGAIPGSAAEADTSKEIPRVFVGRIGLDQTVRVIEIEGIQTISHPDGSIGLTRRTIAELALGMKEGSVLWVRRNGSTNDEFDQAPTELSFVDGKVKIVLVSKQVLIDDEPTHFSDLQYRLLEYMATHAGELVSRAELLDEFWGGLPKQTRTDSVHMSQIRKKLGDHSWILQTRQRMGYILDDSQDPAQPRD